MTDCGLSRLLAGEGDEGCWVGLTSKGGIRHLLTVWLDLGGHVGCLNGWKLSEDLVVVCGVSSCHNTGVEAGVLRR